jgi:6-pyruvoyltetrahydropterin/6-carboxytetrahydropterin synthase
MQSVKVKHNVEMAHRLSQLPGKCEQIHGHSWWVTLEVFGEPDATGVIINFTDMKKAFRGFLDGHYDHRLLLNKQDPLLEDVPEPGQTLYPGLQVMKGDPNTENFAELILQWAIGLYGGGNTECIRVEVWETSVNCATSEWYK